MRPFHKKAILLLKDNDIGDVKKYFDHPSLESDKEHFYVHCKGRIKAMDIIKPEDAVWDKIACPDQLSPPKTLKVAIFG